MQGGKYDLVVLLPVLDEANNIDSLVDKLLGLDIDLAVFFVVTCNNLENDPTLCRVRQKAEEASNVFYICNQARGIGYAYNQGVDYVQKHFDFEWLCAMDGDWSHDPGYIRTFWDFRGRGDVIVGSRYIRGGRINKWNRIRLAGSIFVNFVFRLAFEQKVFDATSGFRLYSRRFLGKAFFPALKAQGYAFQVEMVARVIRKGGVVLEVPYDFDHRYAGRSKFRIIDCLEYIRLFPGIVVWHICKKIGLGLKTAVTHLRLAIRVFLLRFGRGPGTDDQSSPLRLMLKLTDECNLACTTCGIWRKQPKLSLRSDRIRGLARQYKRALFFLTLTGGEPFLKPELLVEAVGIFKRYSPCLNYVSINTNGFASTRIYGTVYQILQKYPDLRLHIGLNHFPDPDWTRERTGSDQAYANALRTDRLLQDLQGIFGRRLRVYRMLTISEQADAGCAGKNSDLWVNFYETAAFYHNEQKRGSSKLTAGDKREVITRFRKQNPRTGLIKKRYLRELETMLNGQPRQLPCYAGKNRVFVDSDGKEYICTRLLATRQEMDGGCRDCWTPCEAVFDILHHPFYPF